MKPDVPKPAWVSSRAAALAAEGVPLGSVVAFLTAAQSSGLDSAAITYGLRGWRAALARGGVHECHPDAASQVLVWDGEQLGVFEWLPAADSLQTRRLRTLRRLDGAREKVEQKRRLS